MANPLKILTALSGTQGANIAGGLTVSTGITTVGTLTASSAQLTTVDINGGTIDSATIATSDITVGAGKTLNVSAGTLTLGAGQVAADKVGAGTFNAGTFSFNGSTISDLGTVTTADINGGTLDNVSIGTSTQSSGKFTSISGSGALDVGGAATLAGGLTVTGAQLNASTVAVSASAVSASSYIGNGSGLSGVIAAGVTANSVALGTDTTGNYVQSVSATANSGIEITNGAAAEGSQPTVGLKNAGSLSSNKVLKWDDTDNQLVNSNITDDGNKVELSTALTGTAAYFSQNLTVVGTASFGLLNVINQQSLNVGDKYIVISSGSTDHTGLEGAGMLWGSGAVGGTLFPDAAAHAAIVFRNSNDRLEIFPGISSSYVTASELNVAGLAKFDGNVTLGNAATDIITVSGLLTASQGLSLGVNKGINVNGSNLLAKEFGANFTASALLDAYGGGGASVSVGVDAGGDFIFAGAGNGDLTVDSEQVGLNKDGSYIKIDITDNDAIKLNGTEKLELTVQQNNGTIQLGNNAGNSIITSGSLYVDGPIYFSASAQDSVGGQVYNFGSNNVETVFSNLVDVVSGLMGSSLTANQVQTAYKGVRFAASTSFLTNNKVVITLSDNLSVGTNSLSNGDFAGDRLCTGSAIVGLSGSSASDLSDKLGQLSFDVTTRTSGSYTWTNDLVSVQV